MTKSSILARLRNRLASSGPGLDEETYAKVDPYIREALDRNKSNGLLLAVRARWIALAITAVMIPIINPTWEALYYEVSLIGFALIGWLQLRIGRVTQSRGELLLMLADIVLITVIMIVPNPFYQEAWPTAFQYQLSEFSYIYIFLAAATLSYSWRTLYAFATWTTILWTLGLILVAIFGTVIPSMTDQIAVVFADTPRILEAIDPNSINLPARIQEIVVFLIVVGILLVSGRRNNALLFQQAHVQRERANLARHFPPNIVDQMAERDQPLGAVRSQDVATMFVDIVGFTRMAESRSPVEVVDLLRQFHGRLEAAVFDHHGTLDKFLGDGLMATFGTPEPNPEDALNALRCAKAMLADIDEWNKDRLAAGDDPVNVSIGLHYGPVVLGDIGSARRLEFAVLGDAVNVASRLETLTRNLGVRLVVSDELISAARDQSGEEGRSACTDLRNLGPQQLRGRQDPVGAWAV